jgi:signal transduction histidine kinase
MMPSIARGFRGLAAWMAAGVCVSVALLTWFGYHAIREWQRSSALLVERRADAAADLLVSALTRDMHAVQKSVLASPDWDAFMLDPPYDVGNIVASAFARYPYPESFFAARGVPTSTSLIFFTRTNRPPPWAPHADAPNRFPVVTRTAPDVADPIIRRITADATNGRRFSIFQLPIGGVPHQIVVRLLYQDQFRDKLEGVFGLTVDSAWVRTHYFPEMNGQIARIGATGSGLAFSISDGAGKSVTQTSAPTADAPTSRRTFPVMFFDPLLVVLNPPGEPAWDEWTVRVSAAADPTLAAAIRGVDRTLMVAAFAAVSLAFGLVLTARAVRASASLAELRADFVATVTHELKTPIATIRAIGDTLASGRISHLDDQREYAGLVVQEAKRLTRLVDNLLAMARITDVADVYSFEPLALDALVETVIGAFRQQLSAARFDASVDIPADLHAVRADRTAITLMLENLVDNAIRYSPDRRSLRISARQSDDGFVRLDIADQGRGIPEDEIGQVTRKFVRGRHAGSGGSGLGLAIVQRIVADHGGRLAIRSVVNVGTTISVSLPVFEDDEETDSGR